MRVPPHEMSTRPTGTSRLNARARSTPNHQPTAVNPPTDSGDATRHAPSTRARGSFAVTWGALNERIGSFAAIDFARSASLAPSTVHSMFDWPEQNHTSPTSTSPARTSSPPLRTTSSRGASDAGIGGSATLKRPSPPATPSARTAPNETSTLAPGAAVPRTGIARSRCSTAWS